MKSKWSETLTWPLLRSQQVCRARVFIQLYSTLNPNSQPGQDIRILRNKILRNVSRMGDCSKHWTRSQVIHSAIYTLTGLGQASSLLWTSVSLPETRYLGIGLGDFKQCLSSSKVFWKYAVYGEKKKSIHFGNSVIEATAVSMFLLCLLKIDYTEVCVCVCVCVCARAHVHMNPWTEQWQWQHTF